MDGSSCAAEQGGADGVAVGPGCAGSCAAGRGGTDGPGGVDSATVGSERFSCCGGGGVTGRWQDVGDRGWRFDGGAIAGRTGVDVDT